MNENGRSVGGLGQAFVELAGENTAFNEDESTVTDRFVEDVDFGILTSPVELLIESAHHGTRGAIERPIHFLKVGKDLSMS